MQVSVPGMKKNSAPYSEQILTYSTALALTGRSAACALLMATRLAAEQRIRVRAVFMWTSCPAIHADACVQNLATPNISLSNANAVKLFHLAADCGFFATLRGRNRSK